MNKIYRLVWNSAQRAWVVAGEFAAAKGKGKNCPRRLSATAAGVVGAVVVSMASIGEAQAYVAGGGLDSGLTANIAIGAATAASGTNSVAVGNNAAASGTDSTAIGNKATAAGDSSLALGKNTVTAGKYTIALGDSASASSLASAGAIALGVESNASFDGATAIGANASASKLNAVAIGRTAVANGDSSVALGDIASVQSGGGVAIGGGTKVTANGKTGTAIGWYATSDGESAMAIGNGSVASGQNSMALGTNAAASGVNSLAQGNGASASGINALSFGLNSSSSARDSVAIGTGAVTPVFRSIAIGIDAGLGSTSTVATTGSNIALGSEAGQNVSDDGVNQGGSNVAISTKAGIGVKGRGNQAFGVQAGNNVTGNDNVAMAYKSGTNVTGNYNHAQGINAGNNVTGDANISIGANSGSTITGSDNLAFGQGAGNNVTASRTMSFGYGSSATANDALALGTSSVSSGVDSVAMGNSAKVTGKGGVALGPRASSDQAGSIAIGDGATATSSASYGAVSIGAGSFASGNRSVALGATSKTLGSGANNVAIGGATAGDATTNSSTNIAMGLYAQVSGGFSTGIGYMSKATGNFSTALGSGATSSGDSSIALGGSSVNGGGAKSLAKDSVALGSYSVANTAAGIAGFIPTGLNAAQMAAISATTSTLGAVSVGDASTGKFRQINGLAAGTADSDAVNVSQLKGVASVADEANERAVKYDWNDANGNGAVDPGEVNYSKATLGGPVSIDGGKTGGTTITNLAQGAVNATSTDAINGSQLFALAGDTSEANTEENGLGIRYVRTNETGLAESDAFAKGQGSTAVGYNALSDGLNSLALGNNAQALANNSVALGAGSVANGSTLGTNAYLTNTVASAEVNVGGRRITGLADGAMDDDAVSVAQLKKVSSATSDVNERALKYDWNDVNGDGVLDPGEVDYSKATLSGDVSTDGGKTGGTKITNLAQGAVNATSTDAINGSQLFAIAGDTSEANTEENGVGIRYVRTNETGLAMSDAFATGMGSTAVGYNAQSVGVNSLALGNGAQSLANNSVALGAGSVADGSTLSNKSYLTNAVASAELNIGGRRITGVADGAMDDDAVTVAQLKKVSTTAGDVSERALKYDWNDLNGDGKIDPGEVDYSKATLGGALSTDGGKTGGTSITNLAQGAVNATSTDAINGSQLFALAGDTSESSTTENGLGVRYVRTNDAGLAESDAFAKGQGSTAVGYNATSNAAGSIAMGQDAQTSVGAINAIAIGKDAVASDANSVALGSGSKTSAAVATTSMTINGNTYDLAGKAPVGTVSVGDVGAERTVTNVAAGRVTATSTDAINGSQLYATNSAIEAITQGVGDLDDSAVKYDRNPDGTVNHNHITLAGNNGPTTITNVAAGVEDTDAVNYSQLHAVENNVTNIAEGTDGMFQVNNTSKLPKPKPTGKDSVAGGAGAVASGDNSLALGTGSQATHNNSVALGSNSVTDRDNSISVGSAGNERQIANVAAGTRGTDAVNVNQLKQGITEANNYTNNKFNDLRNMVDDQKDKLSAGIAGAMAMASLPQPYQPGASMVSMGGGTYQGEAAIALGVSTISDNGKWVTKLSGTTTSQGDVGAAVGVGYQW